MKKMIIGFAVAIITAASLSSCSKNDKPITGPGLTKQITSTRVEMIPITAPRYGCAGQILKHPKLLGMEPELYTTSETIKISDEEIQDIGYTYTGGRDSINSNWMYDPNFLLWAAGIVGLILLAFTLADRYRSKTPPPATPPAASSPTTGLSTEITKVISGLTPTGGTVKVSSKGGDSWEVTIPTPPKKETPTPNKEKGQ